jgi:hypothetical protein
MKPDQKLVVTAIATASCFVIAVVLAGVAALLPKPLNQFGFLLPGVWWVWVMLNVKNLGGWAWTFWCKVRRNPN